MQVIDTVQQNLSGGKSDKIEPKEAVLVSFEGRIADDRSITNGTLFQKTTSWLIIVGDSDVVPALDMVRQDERKDESIHLVAKDDFSVNRSSMPPLKMFATSFLFLLILSIPSSLA
jgi:hypothetical protein